MGLFGFFRRQPPIREIKELYRIIQSLASRIVTETKLPTLPPSSGRPPVREVPTEALTLYSKALLYEDTGNKAKAIEFYEAALRAFPDFTEAKEGLRKAKGAGT